MTALSKRLTKRYVATLAAAAAAAGWDAWVQMSSAVAPSAWGRVDTARPPAVPHNLQMISRW